MLSQTVKKDSTILSNIWKNEQQKSNKIVKNLSECFGCLFLLIVYHMAAGFNQSIAEAICHSVTPAGPWTRWVCTQVVQVWGRQSCPLRSSLSSSLSALDLWFLVKYKQKTKKPQKTKPGKHFHACRMLNNLKNWIIRERLKLKK